MAIRLGILGMGYAGRQHLLAARSIDALRVVAVADVSPTKHLNDLASVRFETDWRTLLDDKSIDAVSICLPHDLHAEATLAALRAAKHVLLEKPLAHRIEDARVIARAAGESRGVCMVEMTHRFYPPVRHARQLVRDGKLGTIFAVEDRLIDPIGPLLQSWMVRKQIAGGGPALTDGIHMLDRVRWVTGRRLRFHHGTVGFTQKIGDIEDTAAMHLSLEDGTPVQLLAAWVPRSGPPDDELTIYGSAGTLRVWAWRGWRFEPVAGEAVQEMCYDPQADIVARSRVGITGALREFADAITHRRPPDAPVDEVLDAEEIVHAFYRHVGIAPASERP